VAVLALENEGLRAKLEAFRRNQTQVVLEAQLPEL
jgi:phosphoribosylcarboxyaminoimidazole (NCAIR) mutase